MLREELEKRKSTCGDSLPKNDLMESLMQVKDEDGNRLTDDEVLDNIVTLMVGEYFSTSLALIWGQVSKCSAKAPGTVDYHVTNSLMIDC